MLRLHHISDPGNLGDNALGIHAYIRKDGWEAARARNPWGARDCPSLDETIAAGHGFIDSWATGCFPDGQAPAVGIYPQPWGHKVTCWPRGPGAFARFDELKNEKNGGLAEFVSTTRVRTDACRKMGLEAGIYLGMPPLGAITKATSYYSRTRTLKAWGKPIIDGGYTRVQLDAAFATSQRNPETRAPEKNAGMYFAEYLLEQGLAVDIETFERVTPELFDWANGRFGIIVAMKDWLDRAGPGWFNHASIGCFTRKFLWLSGSVPVADRIAAADECRAATAEKPGRFGVGTEPVVELGQVAEKWWRGSGQ